MARQLETICKQEHSCEVNSALYLGEHLCTSEDDEIADKNMLLCIWCNITVGECIDLFSQLSFLAVVKNDGIAANKDF